MAKTLLELLSKRYTAPDKYQQILESGVVVSSRADREKRCLETTAEFPFVVDKKTLYEIENEVAKAYELNYFRLFPKYNSELFDYKYIPDILLETERKGIVAKGFFSEYSYEINGDKLTVFIPFDSSGITLLVDAKTPSVISDIIYDEYGKRFNVSIDYSGTTMRESDESAKRRLEEIDRQLIEAEKSYEMHLQSSRDFTQKKDEPLEERELLPRLTSVYEHDLKECAVEDGKIKIGTSLAAADRPTVHWEGDSIGRRYQAPE